MVLGLNSSNICITFPPRNGLCTYVKCLLVVPEIRENYSNGFITTKLISRIILGSENSLIITLRYSNPNFIEFEAEDRSRCLGAHFETISKKFCLKLWT